MSASRLLHPLTWDEDHSKNVKPACSEYRKAIMSHQVRNVQTNASPYFELHDGLSWRSPAAGGTREKLIPGKQAVWNRSPTAEMEPPQGCLSNRTSR